MEQQPLWQQVDLIGRDRLLESKILPRIRSSEKRFALKGDAGMGKTALMQWCAAHTPNSLLISGASTYAQIVKEIADAWQVEADSPKLPDLEKAILAQTGRTIYVDDLHKAQPKLLALLKILAERHRVCGAILAGIKLKEELKQLLWGVETLTLPRLDKPNALRLSKKVCLAYGSKASARDVAAASQGIPGKIVSFAAAGEVARNEVLLKSEEIDIAPMFLVAGGAIVLFRLIGRATDATDLTLIGGASMVIMMFLRLFLARGKEK